MNTTTQQSSANLNRSISQDQHSQQQQGHDQLQPVDDIVDYVQTYARQNPGTAALWCFGIGFIVGWKLKPW
ncbi:hypothetical protein [Gimesia aquarii]|uniref:Uncharacterized protein n=1 Tax=Gimesia aquarii TaxID=2527964 RepID=A0A517WX52_9PLAN|nr:hypothetical protein [Gimesia aquarii]QDU09818.1 hypothetical protein V202x_32150 [Gimesia aquarii]